MRNKKLNQKEAVQKYNLLMKKIIAALKETYGPYWNFSIDFIEGGDPKKNYEIHIKIGTR